MTREQIRQCADIVRESVSARDYAALIGLPINRNGFCQCPFHSGDNNGSLMLYKGTRGWHCFGCGASGDVIELAKRYFSLTFPQAIAKVAEDTGIALPGTGQMTYDQAKAFQSAQDRKDELKKNERKTDIVEEKYFTALDAFLDADRKLADITDPLYKTVQRMNAGLFSEEEVAQAHREYAAHWKEVSERVRKGGKVVPPWKKPGFKPHPIIETKNGANIEFTPELIGAINARNNAKTVMEYLEIRRTNP